MALLTLAGATLDLKKVVISLRFRIPASVASAIAGNTEAFPCSDSSASNIGYVTSRTIPFITCGGSLSAATYTLNTENTGVNASTDGDCPPCPDIEYTNWGSSSGSQASPPTFIGVHADGGNIVVNIQPNDKLSATNLRVGSFSPVCLNCFPPPGAQAGYDFTLEDQSVVAEFYDNFGAVSGVTVSFDTWHHLLISWDVTEGCAGRGANSDPPTDPGPFITTASKMWLAIDDVNINGSNLPAALAADFDGTGGLGGGSSWGANDIASNLVGYWSGVHDQGLGAEIPLSLTVSTVPSDPISIPGALSSTQCDGSAVNPSNQLVELSDLQVFTGVSLDTSVESNRRAFTSSTNGPVSPLLAAAILGKSPEILFQTADDWITGNNRGTAGNFTPSGSIAAFTPAP